MTTLFGTWRTVINTLSMCWGDPALHAGLEPAALSWCPHMQVGALPPGPHCWQDIPPRDGLDEGVTRRFAAL